MTYRGVCEYLVLYNDCRWLCFSTADQFGPCIVLLICRALLQLYCFATVVNVCAAHSEKRSLYECTECTIGNTVGTYSSLQKKRKQYKERDHLVMPPKCLIRRDGQHANWLLTAFRPFFSWGYTIQLRVILWYVIPVCNKRFSSLIQQAPSSEGISLTQVQLAYVYSNFNEDSFIRDVLGEIWSFNFNKRQIFRDTDKLSTASTCWIG